MIDHIAQHGIVARLQSARPDLLAVYLFGSHAQGHAGPDSDVDLVGLRSASTVLQYQVITTGVRLWAKNAEAGLFE